MDHHTYTQQYVEILRDTLRISENHSGEMTYIWGDNTEEELIRRLENHMNAYTDTAISSTKEAAKSQMYSFHFGHSPHLNETLKYAPLYTDHVVLQDIVYRTLLNHDNARLDRVKESVLQYIRNILQWEPLIESGHISILPSPYLWSSKIRGFLRETDGMNVVCSQPLLAADRLHTSPFTDSPTYCDHMTQMAKLAGDLTLAAEDGTLDTRSTEFDPINEYQNTKIMSVGSRLFGEHDADSSADLYYISNASYEDVIELANEFDGFRVKFNSIIKELVTTTGGEVEEILEQAPEEIEEEYKIVKREITFRRDAMLGGAGIAGLTLSLPLFINISPSDLLTTAHLLSTYSDIEEIVNLVINVTGGISGGIALHRIAEELYSDEYDFYNVISEFDHTNTKNGHVESFIPV